jgi:hypothetical protein
MSKLEKISGVINTTSLISSISGYVDTDSYSGRVSGNTSTQHSTVFRVNDTPCRFNGSPNLNIGDIVTVVGKRKGEVHVLALKNETTNVRYKQSINMLLLNISYIYVGMMPVVFLWLVVYGLIGAFFGLFFIPALAFLYMLIKIRREKKEIENALRMLN